MKKLLLNVLIGLTGLYLQAQIAPGSDAPDFTVTDVNGNIHTLSNYLAQGKTVIIDVSATWCSPCWNFHHSGNFENLYNTYGPGGSDEIVVLFVEGDSNTSLECLYGISEENLTWGNWVEHSSFPIINSSELAQLYEVNYFPTFFRICPDGKVSVIGQPPGGVLALTPNVFEENISANCEVLNGLNNHAIPHIDNIKVCEGSSVSPKVTITNYGMQAITTATIELRNQTEIIATQEFSGNINFLENAEVNFEDIVINPGQNYEAFMALINNEVPDNVTSTHIEFEVIESSEANNNITVNVYTNSFPDKISWAIKNSLGSYVASGGPYQEEDADTAKIHNVTLSATDTECYSVEFYSTNGYGWDGGDTPHGIEILSGGETVFSQFVESFGFVLEIPHAFKSNGTLGIIDINQNDFLLYPNPTSGQITVVATESSVITLYDMTGKQVFEKRVEQGETQLNLSSLSKGVYMANFKGETTNIIKKIIVE